MHSNFRMLTLFLAQPRRPVHIYIITTWRINWYGFASRDNVWISLHLIYTYSTEIMQEVKSKIQEGHCTPIHNFSINWKNLIKTQTSPKLYKLLIHVLYDIISENLQQSQEWLSEDDEH